MELSLLSDGLILDATAAVILTQRGIDVGLVDHGKLQKENIPYLCTRDPEYKSFISDGSVKVLNVSLAKNAEPVLFSTKPGDKKPMAYRYENKDGQRFLVFLFEAASIYSSTRVGLSGLTKNPAVQNVLHEFVPWVAAKPLPAAVTGNPELYVMCRKDEDTTSVALFNCFADPVLQPEIRLDGTYSRIECVNCTAELNGNCITLTDTLYGYQSCVFKVYK